MAARTTDVDVVLDHNHEYVPSCPHGPTLLFEKFGGQKSGKRFFACSAFRDRKECSFFRWEDEKSKESTEEVKYSTIAHPKLTHREYRERFKKFKKLPVKERSLCQTCGLFLLPGEQEVHKSQGHELVTKITKSLLRTPSKLFKPLDNNKTYAQYLFSDAAVDFVINSLAENLHITHVLCVGTPRIHEAITNRRDPPNLQSLLLDLDSRYMQLYSSRRFCHYNMFNHHFFNGQSSQAVFEEFLAEDETKKVAMVIDPPFGGMVETLSAAIKLIMDKWKQASFCKEVFMESTRIPSTKEVRGEIPVLWFFPYFFEPRIQSYLHTFQMLDYKVDYDNHTLFRGDKKKLGSPVRIFTNVAADMILLPEEDGYWYCKVCKRYSARENLHCDVCDSCTSKDGRTYRHCFECDKCVKPSKIHCATCKSCQLPDHRCGVRQAGCHVCGDLGHKRKECPNRGQVQQLKRKNSREYTIRCKKKKLA